MQTKVLRQSLRSHMPQLDGVRGIAILWVILHNAALDNVGPSQSPLMSVIDLLGQMGWVGVQLFFVLSGFLITGILLDGRGATNQFRHFYARRTLRIFPLYYGFLCLAFVILPWSGLVHWSQQEYDITVFYWSYLANWAQPFSQHNVFPHLWSLAIEEQYYLLWPLLVVFLRKRSLVYVCLGLIVTAILGRAYLVFNFEPSFSSRAMYTFTFARWDALAIGSLLAVLVRSEAALPYIKRYFSRSFVILGGLLLLEIAVLRNFEPSHIPGIFNQTSIALWFALLVLLSIVPWQNRLDRLRPLFSSRLLRTVGKYSYAMYLFHFPGKMIWFRYFAIPVQPDSPWQQLGVAAYNFIGLSLFVGAAAFISWHLWEVHFLKLKRRFVLQRVAVPG
ncbi:MAG: acyltransferase [Gammaproteobacteria bacterium]